MLLAAARAGFLNGSAPVAAAASEIDDIAATEEEERVITEQMASKCFNKKMWFSVTKNLFKFKYT